MIEFISQPWHWSVSGVMIAVTMFLLLYFGKQFGVSSTLRTLCAVGGGGKFSEFFRFNWKDQIWNIIFVAGGVIGGWIASTWLNSPDPVAISQNTIQFLGEVNVSLPGDYETGSGFMPIEVFNFESLLTARGFIMIVVGGLFVGFGTRWAGGCTSGHAISGLSNLQLPSLIAVIGFFAGGLIMTHLILPWLLML